MKTRLLNWHILASAIALVVAGCGSTPNPSSAPEGFPTEVLGMPVLSVGGANLLIAQGKLDGRVAAVGGWWVQPAAIGCPAPGRWMAQLETWCSRNIFASQGFAAMICTPDGNSCSSNGPPPGTDVLEPIFGNESDGWTVLSAAANSGIWKPLGYVPAVLLGHADDPRQWECPAETRADCARKFVVDRVAWVDGQEPPLAAAGDQLNTNLTADEAIAAANTEAVAIVASAIRASAAPTHDPRFHLVGDGVAWLIRTIAAQGADADDPTHSVDVFLVDDATGQLLQSLPLAMEEGFSPALLRFQAASPDDCCAGNIYPRYEVYAANGVGLVESQGSGWSSGTETGGTRWLAGAPAVLGGGDYVVHAWLTTGDGGAGDRHFECQTTVSLVEGQEARVEAAFPHNGPCTFVEPTFDDTI